MALSMMEAVIAALVQCCKKLFSIMDAMNKVGPAVGIPVDNTSIQDSVQKDNARLLVLV